MSSTCTICMWLLLRNVYTHIYVSVFVVTSHISSARCLSNHSFWLCQFLKQKHERLMTSTCVSVRKHLCHIRLECGVYVCVYIHLNCLGVYLY